MTVIDTQAFAIPNDPVIIKQIKDACFEISASFTRIEGEKNLIKEAVIKLSKDTSIPKKHLNKIARLFHKSNKDVVEAEQGVTNELYDRIFLQVPVHEEGRVVEVDTDEEFVQVFGEEEGFYIGGGA